ncbi:formate dehydrogenase accessory sulfurtransferase FdhD [Roseococcus pinisoli]|uniref:formate dehydrogenase accessory sulfurtransferase FdhD n=1 Tax=Roseococcus pinisoli TaxID=2835040 RepID=UPI0020C17871|nr:formate dehydrogenase accessory sulfurtransferase FdhD [Roseococcus pinisoli]
MASIGRQAKAIPTSREVTARRVPATGGPVQEVARLVAIEAPVGLVYGFQPYAVMMTTPADLEDFAIGFSLTEGIIRSPVDIRGLSVEEGADGMTVTIDLVPDRLHALLANRRLRNTVGRTGCGVCGVEELAALPLAERRGGQGEAIAPEAIHRALEALAGGQPLNAATRAVHAAAWAGSDGELRLLREDVGRHNALDKLIGALLRSGTDPAEGFIVITSRLSFEMVEKAAAFGAGTLVAISAPTSLALDRARRHGMTLVAIAREDGHMVFVEPESHLA